MSLSPNQILFILGPTASGKSSLAIDVAQACNGEIISCDSMQIYKHMTIGTAQPTLDEQQAVPHHLINELDISQPWDANRFSIKAKQLIQEIQNRHAIPIIVGGTGMYARSLAYQMPLQPSDKQLFQQICREYEEGKEKELQQELLAAGGTLHPDTLKNWRRLLRAVEVLRLTGKPPIQTESTPLPQMMQWILLPDWQWLKQRISLRTQQMLEQGWIEETQHLIELGIEDSPTAKQALGYRDIIQWLKQEPPQSIKQLHQTLETKTFQYARRQRTWFKKQHPGAELFSPSNPEQWQQLRHQLIQRLKQ